MIKAVIFDMDGTMVETETLWQFVNSALAKEYGCIFNDTVRVQMMGRKEDEALAIFKEYYHLTTVPLEELIAKRRKMLLENMGKIAVNPGLHELLETLETMHIAKAIATSSFHEFAHRVISSIGVLDKFPIFITGDQIKKSKPDPEIFLMAASKLHVLPENCLVIEDAQNGVEAGINANMKVIAVPHMHSRNHDFSKANIIIDSLLQVTPELLSSF